MVLLVKGETMDAMVDGEVLQSGTRPLILLATTLNFLIVRALAEGPLRLAELRRATGLPAQTTLRGHLSSLEALGIVAKRQASQAPSATENELTPAGRELLRVAESLEAWLNHAPDGPLSLETGSAKGVIKALVDGWGSTILGTLARRPMSLTELDHAVPALSYPALERRLSSMRMAGLVEAAPAVCGSGRPYTVTPWARQGVAPLVAATHCEQVEMRRLVAPVTEVEIVTSFLLSVPLVGLPQEVAGRCHLTVDGDPANGRERTGVEVIVEGGQVVFCAAGPGADSGQYATGSAGTWFSAVRDARLELLDYAGGQLPMQVVRGLHEALHEPDATAAEGGQPVATSRALASPTNGTSSS
jgi:DNA-binding HxlR family transcriptional regulator